MSVILYDLPSRDPCKCWSPNPWKARMSLNYKGVDYETKWLEYPDIGPTFEKLGIPANSQGVGYTIPTACIDGKYVMDSLKIAEVLESRNPTPSLHLDDPMTKRVLEAGPQAILEMRPIFVPIVPENLLNDKSLPFYYESRKERLGMPLDQYKDQIDMEAQWEKATSAFSKVAELLKEKPGPYFLGNEASFGDFIIVSFLHFCRRLDGSIFFRLVNIDKSFGELYGACEKWLARDDH